MADIKKKNKERYINGNKNLPKAGTELEITPFEIAENLKCKNDVFHFANYFYIISVDLGRIPIKLYDCQTRVLKSMATNRFVLLCASRQIGKMLDLDTPVLTSKGWKTQGTLKVGDQIYDDKGKICNVTHVHEIHHNRTCYKVIFDNGEEIVADEEHEWYTETQQNTVGSIKTTKEIKNSLLNNNTYNHRIPKAGPLDNPPADYSPISQQLNDSKFHYIIDIQNHASVPMRCITVDSPSHLYLAGRQLIPTHNSTLFTIYALWLAMFNNDQRIVIVANKEETAMEIYDRIRLAYEELPNWLKSGIKEWAKTYCEFANGSKIEISATTGSSGRGKSINLLILDECAFIENHLMDPFWKAVQPTISSSKTGKIFIASTPNGVGNLFHRLYTGAVNGTNNWALNKIHWSEIPDRDETWMKETRATVDDEEAWQQEYEMEFLGGGESSVDAALAAKLESDIAFPAVIQREDAYKIWEYPEDGQIYLAGIDVSEGLGEDASVVEIINATDLTDIRQCAEFVNKRVNPYEFTELSRQILRDWGNPIVSIERNGPGGQIIDKLYNDWDYPNIVSFSADVIKQRVAKQRGCVANVATKQVACRNGRYWINELKCVKMRSDLWLNEYKHFVKRPNGSWGAMSGFHDDRVMAVYWSLIPLEDHIIEQYFEIKLRDSNNKPQKIVLLDPTISSNITSQSEIYIPDTDENRIWSFAAAGSSLENDMVELNMQGWHRL